MDRTSGEFETEDDATEYIDNLLCTASDLFVVYKQVEGSFWSTRIGAKQMRIDRVLWPKRQLINLGWNHGAVGVEIKKSAHPVGDLVNQASDYVESMWHLPQSGVRFSLNSVFVFPSFENTGALASVMAARRIGHIAERNGHLCLFLNKSKLLDFWPAAGWSVGTSPNIRCGMKAGSR
jgi:hypothetical protein